MGRGGGEQGGCVRVMAFEVDLVLTGQWEGRKGMPDGRNSIGLGSRHGVLQECSLFQLGGRIGCLRERNGGDI